MRINVRHITGSAVVFVPPNFKGALRLRTRFAQVNLLPAFAENARVINADEHGTIVLYGDADFLSLGSACEPTSDGLDYCFASSTYGSVQVGVTGVDRTGMSAALHLESQYMPSFVKKNSRLWS